MINKLEPTEVKRNPVEQILKVPLMPPCMAACFLNTHMQNNIGQGGIKSSFCTSHTREKIVLFPKASVQHLMWCTTKARLLDKTKIFLWPST